MTQRKTEEAAATDAANPLEAGARNIRSLREALAKLAGERGRIAALAGSAAEHADEIARLKQQRAETLAVALVDGDAANTRELDTRIAAAEGTAREALAAGETARDALRVIDERRAALDGKLSEAIAQQLEVAMKDLQTQHRAAVAAYNAAANALRSPLETMRNIEAALDTVRRREAQLAGNPRWVPGAGLSFYIARELRDVGLCAVRDDRQIGPCSWLIGPQVTGGSQEFCRDYLGDAALD